VIQFFSAIKLEQTLKDILDVLIFRTIYVEEQLISLDLPQDRKKMYYIHSFKITRSFSMNFQPVFHIRTVICRLVGIRAMRVRLQHGQVDFIVRIITFLKIFRFSNLVL
jgi:hypothetical protein